MKKLHIFWLHPNENFLDVLEEICLTGHQLTVVKKQDIIDLTSKLNSDGFLEWNAPTGDWVILRIGHTPTGEMNRFPSDGGRGLECDKMNKQAVDDVFAIRCSSDAERRKHGTRAGIEGFAVFGTAAVVAISVFPGG